MTRISIQAGNLEKRILYKAVEDGRVVMRRRCFRIILIDDETFDARQGLIGSASSRHHARFDGTKEKSEQGQPALRALPDCFRARPALPERATVSCRKVFIRLGAPQNLPSKGFIFLTITCQRPDSSILLMSWGLAGGCGGPGGEIKPLPSGRK